MTKKLLVSVISIFLLVLGIVTSTLAWYVSNGSVETTETVLTAAHSVDFTVSVVPTTDYAPYMGQTGLNKGTDSVYSVDFAIGMQYDVQGLMGMGVKVSFNDINIMKVDPENPGSSILMSADTGAFAWRLYDYTVSEGHYVKLAGYKPDSGNFIVSDDGTETPYIITGSGNMTFLFTLLFQSEENYVNWLVNVFDYDAFPYSTPDYMDAIFNFSVNFSLEYRAG